MGRTAFIHETLPNKYEAYALKIIGNIAICAFGAECSGVPSDWQAKDTRAGIAYLPAINNEMNVNIAFDIIRSSLINL